MVIKMEVMLIWRSSIQQNTHHNVVSIAQATYPSTLPLTIHSMTGSKNVVTLLNQYGHGISYTQLEQVQTAIADRTLFGKNITHCTNGIMIQRQKGSQYTLQIYHRYVHSNSSDIAVSQRSKCRVITPPSPTVEQYYQKQRCGPENMEMNLTEITLEQMESAQRKDFAWFLAHFADCGNIFKARDGPQNVTSW